MFRGPGCVKTQSCGELAEDIPTGDHFSSNRRTGLPIRRIFDLASNLDCHDAESMSRVDTASARTCR